MSILPPSTSFQNANDDFIVQTHLIEIKIQNPLSILVSETIVVQNNSSSTKNSVDLCLNQYCAELSIEDSFGPLSYSSIPDSNNITIEFRESIPESNFAIIDLYYYLDCEIDWYEDEPSSYYHFYFEPPLYYFTENQKITVILPESTLIHESYPIPPIFPITDPAEYIEFRLTVIWKFNDKNPDPNHYVWIMFDEPPKNPPIWYYIVGPIFALALGVAGTVWIMRKRESRAVKKIGEMFLSDVQKEFLKIIVEHEGKISQKELLAKTGYTKTRVSRNLISLEQQGLIKREKWGRNYRIYITETGERVIK
jgi:hypothetical protein